MYYVIKRLYNGETRYHTMEPFRHWTQCLAVDFNDPYLKIFQTFTEAERTVERLPKTGLLYAPSYIIETIHSEEAKSLPCWTLNTCARLVDLEKSLGTANKEECQKVILTASDRIRQLIREDPYLYGVKRICIPKS